MSRHKTLITYLGAFIFTLTTISRTFSDYRGEPIELPAKILVGVFFLLLLLEPWLSRRSHGFTHLYLLAQTAITTVLLFMPPHADYFAVLFFVLTLQSLHVLPTRIGFRWVGGFCLIMAAAMIIGFGWGEGMAFVANYVIAYFLIGSFMAVIREAEAARDESNRLLEELQEAHKQLQTYTAQAEELAVAAERNRLARDLHDSVTQSLFSLTLFTQAARELADAGNLDQIKHNLTRIADTGGQALKEMRLLVYQLRPLALKDAGLVGALQDRLDTVEGRAGVQARLLVEAEGELELPPSVEEELYRVAQEALNNALKHAHATSVTVEIAKPAGGSQLVFKISDNGHGFDVEKAKSQGGLGLTSMRERVEGLGGELIVSSTPGEGTQIRVELEIVP